MSAARSSLEQRPSVHDADLAQSLDPGRIAGSPEGVSFLLKYGADTAVKNDRGQTPLQTPLDIAEAKCQKLPGNESYRKIAALLRK